MVYYCVSRRAASAIFPVVLLYQYLSQHLSTMTSLGDRKFQFHYKLIGSLLNIQAVTGQIIITPLRFLSPSSSLILFLSLCVFVVCDGSVGRRAAFWMQTYLFHEVNGKAWLMLWHSVND